jgi:hypothetical protein
LTDTFIKRPLPWTSPKSIHQGNNRHVPLEFILHAIADRKKITVEDKDLEHLFGHLKDRRKRRGKGQFILLRIGFEEAKDA